MPDIDKYLKEAHDAIKVESSIREITLTELISEILDKMNTYEVIVAVGRYTYVIFEDCKYILNNDFFESKIRPLWKLTTNSNRP